MLVRCLPASVQSARSVFEKNTHDLRAFHSTTDSTDLTDKIWLEANTERSESNPTLGNREHIIGNRRLPKFV